MAFPQSIWETYSAFANTLGGVILLGVEEHRDHSLHTVDLPDPERLINEFWEIINDPKKVSVNILTEDQIQTVEADGNHIIAITVPRAQRYDRPVYIDGNPLSGSYRRNGRRGLSMHPGGSPEHAAGCQGADTGHESSGIHGPGCPGL